MLRDFRSFIYSFLLPSCIWLSACDSHSSTSDTAKATPSAAPSVPAPDVSKMIERMTTQDGSKDFTAEMRMTSVDSSGKHDQIDFRIQRKYSGDRALTFLTVLAPREESDKAFLSIEQERQPTQAFSYLAGLNRLTRINSDRQLGFRGARVTVQELLGMELNQYSYSAGERVKEGNEQLVKVEFKEQPDRFLAYSRIIGFFRESDQNPVRFELYDSRSELQKTINFSEVKQIQNRQTITQVAIDDIQQKLKLKLETRKIEYDRGLPDSMFTENHLKSFISGASRKLDQTR